MSLDYYKKTDEDKIILENRLNELVNNIDKLSFMSLIIFTIPPLLKILTDGNTTIEFVVYLTFYITFGLIV